MDGAVLVTILSLILRSLPRRHQAFEFLKPVEDDDQLRGRFRFAVINYYEVFTVSDSRDLPERSRSVT